MALSPLDPWSHSRPEDVIVTDICIHLTVDFEEKIFYGHVELDVDRINCEAKELILDCKDLNIETIIDTNDDERLKFYVSEPVKELGSKLTIILPERDDESYVLLVQYSTSPNASGLQWLTSEQTLGKKHPFVFSQFQPTHARSFLPCQDTPGVKTGYSAEITVPDDLIALMSAQRNTQRKCKKANIFYFTQKVPIPSYLIAIAIGPLKSKRIGPKSEIWAEEEILEASAYEFTDTEDRLDISECICGPYLWGPYDILVLPPSFAYDGTEYPCLAFVAPTFLAGDRSLTNVVAHEITHSWSGNLVTSRNFEHSWLSEGFAAFIGRKICGYLNGIQEQDFSAYMGTIELEEMIKSLGEDHPYTSLVVDLEGKDPDDAYSVVPFEKGYTFLRYLESVIGGPKKFEPFLEEYFQTFKYVSLDSYMFQHFFMDYFSSIDQACSIDWDLWFHSPGMPPIIPDYDMTLANVCKEFVQKWTEWEEDLDEPSLTEEEFLKLSVAQVIHILQEITSGTPQSVAKIQKTEAMLKFNESGNSEIRFRWLRVCLKARWEARIDDALEFVTKHGRMKFVRALYRDMYEWEASRQRAVDNFHENEKFYMGVVATGLRKDLHLDK